MGLRTALDGTWYVTLPVLAFLAWIAVKWFAVFNTMEGLWHLPAIGAGQSVGQVAISGIVGLVVMIVIAGLLVVLYGELGEATASPSAWPPDE